MILNGLLGNEQRSFCCFWSPFWRRSALGFLWKEWCKSWNSSTLATSCKDLTHWKRLWCWEGLGAGGEGDDRGWDGWMASLTRWTWDWVNSGSWWWTGRPGMLQFMGSQRVGHDWATELNWTDGVGLDSTVLWLYELFDIDAEKVSFNLSCGSAGEHAFKVRLHCILTPCSSLVCGWGPSGSPVSSLCLWGSSPSGDAESLLTAGAWPTGAGGFFLEGCH